MQHKSNWYISDGYYSYEIQRINTGNIQLFEWGASDECWWSNI